LNGTGGKLVGQTERRMSKPRLNKDSLHKKSNFLSEIRGRNAEHMGGIGLAEAIRYLQRVDMKNIMILEGELMGVCVEKR